MAAPADTTVSNKANHHKRRRDTYIHGNNNGAPKDVWVGTCHIHGKRVYIGRAAAKRAIRDVPDQKAMREYPCRHIADAWHIGHLPKIVRKGARTADEIYGGEP